jgi:hypothetical protein
MSHRFRRSLIAGPLAVCVAVAGSASIAHASDAGLSASVKADVPQITRTQAKVLDGLAAYEKTHSTSVLIKAIRAQDSNLETLKSKLSGEAPSSATGTKAKAEIIKGLGLIVSSNKHLVNDLQKGAAGKSVSKAQLRAVIAADKKGNLDFNTGAKLLGV